MKSKRRKELYRNLLNPATVLVLFIGLLAGCHSLELKSRWRDREVVIDGINKEWKDSLTALDDHGTSVAVLNDDQFLYIGLVSTNRDLQRQVMRQGLTIWFDRNGGEDKKFGIHYPLGGGGFGYPPANRGDEGNGEGRENQGGNQFGEERPPDFQRDTSASSSNELELFGPTEGDHHRMTIAEAGGITVRVRTANGMMVYELKVPLVDNGSQPFVIGTKPGSLIGVGVESLNARGGDQASRESSEGGGGRGGGYGGRGGGFGGRGGGRRGGGGGRSGSQVEPFKVWAKLQLASGT